MGQAISTQMRLTEELDKLKKDLEQRIQIERSRNINFEKNIKTLEKEIFELKSLKDGLEKKLYKSQCDIHNIQSKCNILQEANHKLEQEKK